MTMKSEQALRLSLGQRVGLIFFFAVMPALGVFAFSSIDYRILSSEWAPQDSIENWLVIGHSIAFVLGVGFFWQFFALLLSSAIRGVIREELVTRYGLAAVEKWFGIKRSAREESKAG